MWGKQRRAFAPIALPMGRGANEVVRVGFVIAFANEGWIGGLNYFRNLLGALHSYAERQIEPVIFTGCNADLSLSRTFPPTPIVQTRLLDRWHPIWLARKAWARVTGRDRVFEAFLRHHGIALLSHSPYLGRGSRIPTIGWIPDFQHKRMPEFFDAERLAGRDHEFAKTCELCSRVLLSSYDAQKDLAQFYPQALAKSRVLQFVADVTYSGAPTLAQIQRKYGFSGPYFYVPNQFWAHKNHWIIVDALRVLKAAGREVLVLATGNPNDSRNPTHFDALMGHAKACGVAELFRVLGIVPYSDVVALMWHAIALLNPSRFEGWSTLVEEAKSLGKRVILADIPIHREQAPPFGVYFDPSDAPALARAMWEQWCNNDAAREAQRSKEAARALLDRKHQFARNFENIALECLRAV